ncbi:hypothetical protein Drorol1_Dr00010163 [Drosera rotundifolia]
MWWNSAKPQLGAGRRGPRHGKERSSARWSSARELSDKELDRNVSHPPPSQAVPFSVKTAAFPAASPVEAAADQEGEECAAVDWRMRGALLRREASPEFASTNAALRRPWPPPCLALPSSLRISAEEGKSKGELEVKAAFGMKKGV